MIARLIVDTENPFLVVEGESYPLFAIDYGNIQAVVHPARRLSEAESPWKPQVELDGRACYIGKGIQIDFLAPAFDRSVGVDCDPSVDIVRSTLNSFLRRYRYATTAPDLRLVDFPRCIWRLEYLNDDGSELASEPGLVRGRGTAAFSVQWIAMDRAAWDLFHTLPPDFEPPVWHSLLLDAHAFLPNVGPAVATAATAMEVFIATLLDQLAARSALPAEWWSWINDRGNHLKEPSTDEQFGELLKKFVGKSAKTAAAWEAYAKLRACRNRFVHTGKATYEGGEVSVATVREWLREMLNLVKEVRAWVPDELKWPELIHPNRTVSIKSRVPIEEERADTG